MRAQGPACGILPAMYPARGQGAPTVRRGARGGPKLERWRAACENAAMARALVAVVRTRPDTVLADVGRVMRLAEYRAALDPGRETLLKLNLSWTKYFPACSSQPWQLDGV